MAEPVAPAGAIQILEDAAHLLRQAPLATMVCHWAGTAPLALALLLFWNDTTNPRTPDSTCALEALLLAPLLVWMNCWRAVFAGRLRRQLSGVPDSPWSRRRLWRLVASQAFLGATKLVAAPLAALIMFPMAWTVSFYRSAAVLADRDDLDPLRMIARARHLAGVQAKQSWALIPILTFLHLLVTVNLAIVLAALPQLVRILTGYESQFSRGGVYFILNPLFLLATLAISWMAFDPFVQAGYCVRCFRAESIETGEDLRAGLRTIRRATQAAGVVLLLLLPAWRAAAAVPPGELEKSVHLAMQSHEYDWRLPPPAASSVRRAPWLVEMTDRLIANARRFLHSAGEVLRRLVDWFRRQIGQAPKRDGGVPPAAGLHWSLYLLIGVMVILTAWIAWRKGWWRRAKPRRAAGGAAGAVLLDAEDLAPDLLPEESWLALAERCLAEENFRPALRAFYLAALAWLGRREFLTIHPGKTNRDYELELRRRARAFPEARGLFAENVAAFERAWYGMHEVSGENVDEFRRRAHEMKTLLAAPQGAAA